MYLVIVARLRFHQGLVLPTSSGFGGKYIEKLNKIW